MPDMLLSVRGLVAGYGSTDVLSGVDLDVAPGEIVAVLGSNGVGKTTLNMALSGVVRARSGVVIFEGRQIESWTAGAIVAAGLIHVPEGRRVFPEMTVSENLELGAYRRGRSDRVVNLEKVYAIFPRLFERRRQAAGTLSGGEQQMLAIGRGLMARPRLLILDEPSLGLSPRLVEEMFSLISQLHREGLSLLIVEQNVMQSLTIAKRAYVLANGRIAMSGAAAELAQNLELKKAYLGM
jgi:branched-chain amino acid transport system ATP-binding protein